MEQASIEVQLQVWKELAISKQVLMQTAAKGLGLPEEYTSEELEVALNKTIGMANNAEAEVKAAQDKAEQAIADMQVKVDEANKLAAAANEAKEAALKAQEVAEQSMDANRANNADEFKKLKAQVADRQKELKQITKVLADTPENVVKKMKTLKKEKMDEAKARKQAEDLSKKLRKEKQTSETTVKEQEELLTQAAEVVTQLRDLNKLANDQFNQLAESADDKDALEKVPALNEDVLELIEKAVKKEEKKSKKK